MLNVTQIEWVENILIEDGKITRNKCLRVYISRLGAIIATLKGNGYKFETQYVDVKTPFGTGKDYEYKVVEYPADVQSKIDLDKQEANDDGVIWGKEPQEQEPTLFDIEYIAINKNDKKDKVTFKAQDDESARHWIINNLDMSREWIFSR